MRIRLAHSPDPDDAFMFYGLSSGAVDSGPYVFEHILEDIQSLNERATRGEYEVTAISIHAYAFVRDKYALTSCGASMGDGYGPMVVTRQPCTLADLRGKTVAIPGKMTTAYLALQLAFAEIGGGFTPRVVMFDQILDEVAAGRTDVGLIIHEGQLTYQRQGLHVVVDLGHWWQRRTDLPLPLGGNAIRRDLGPEHCRQIAQIIRRSIEYSLAHRGPAVEYALRYGRGLDAQLADRFVGMYVNDWTLDYGPRGKAAITRLLSEATQRGLVPDSGMIDFVDAGE